MGIAMRPIRRCLPRGLVLACCALSAFGPPVAARAATTTPAAGRSEPSLTITTPASARVHGTTPSTTPATVAPGSAATPGAGAGIGGLAAKPGAAAGLGSASAHPGRAHKAATRLSTGAIVAAALAALLIVVCLVWGAARWWAYEPRWSVSLRHSLAEAEWRLSASWDEFQDWARLGR